MPAIHGQGEEMENTVVENLGLSLDDATVETPNNQEQPQPEGQSLEDALSQPEKPEEAEKPQKEPGYIKKRIDAALAKEREAIKAELQAEFEARMKPLLDAQLERDADELVKQGEFKSKERALKYLRMERNLPVEAKPEPKQEPTRNEQGQFVKQEEIPAEVTVRAERLLAQDRYARENGDVSPLEIYKSNPAVAAKVNSGEWDFADVVKATKGVPPPIRTSNGAQPHKKSPSELSSEELKNLDKFLKGGGKVDMRR